MKHKILQLVTVIMLITVLTMANFILLGFNMVTYAVDAINQDKSTNNKNVEFMAYFKNEEGNRVTDIDATVNTENLKLYLEVSVKNEGYLNGTVTLDNANFSLKPDILSDSVSKIEGNTVYLNQINAGETEEIELGIELVKDEQFDLSLLNMESKISLKGTYKDSTEKDIEIAATKAVRLTLISPYSEEDPGSILTQEVITNKVLNYNGEDRRVIQIKVEAGIEGNALPIKTTAIEITTPKIGDKNPETVLVNSLDKLATNGKMLEESNWAYNAEAGLVNINIENTANENKVSWVKEGHDVFVITYIYDTVEETTETINSIKLQINLYDTKNTRIGATAETTLGNIEKDSIITLNQEEMETSIYKGKLYAGIDRDISYKTILNVNLDKVVDTVQLAEGNTKVQVGEETSDINSVYKTSTINKQNIIDVLGNDGQLIITNSITKQEIIKITKDSQVDEQGNVVINYPENVTGIEITTTEPQKVGKIEINTVKTIKRTNTNLIKNATSIVNTVSGKYVSNTKETTLGEVASTMQLQETQTEAKLEINKTELSTMTTNNVEIRVTLKSRNENNELYKNPKLKIEIPEKFEKVEITSINLLYEEEMKIVNPRQTGNIIEIDFSGEQTSYKDEAIEGAVLIINANLTTNKKATTSTEKIKLTYTNENAINYKEGANQGTETVDVKVTSYAGVITTNRIQDYNLEVINNEGEKTATIATNSESKIITIEQEIINNKETQISNVMVLGTFPTKDAIKGINNIETAIDSRRIYVQTNTQAEIAIYYSENAEATTDLTNAENGWTDHIQNISAVKKYLVVADYLNVLEEIKVVYQVKIPEKLDYNLTAQEGYDVYYTGTTEESIELDNITLETGKGAVIDTTLKAYVGGEERTEVKEGEIIKYQISVSNTGTVASDVINIEGKVPEGTTYVEYNSTDKIYVENPSISIVQKEVGQVNAGETKTLTYEVKVNNDTVGNQLSNVITAKYGDMTKTSNEIVNQVKKKKISLTLVSVEDHVTDELSPGSAFRFKVSVKNNTNNEIKNIRVEFPETDSYEVLNVMYTDMSKVEYGNEIMIESLAAGEEIQITAKLFIKTYLGEDLKILNIISNAYIDDDKYSSNELNMKVKSVKLDAKISVEKEGEYVKAGDTIKYKVTISNLGNNTTNNIIVRNYYTNYVTVQKVLKNNTPLTSEQYTDKISENNQRCISIENDTLAGGETVEYTFEVIVDYIQGNTEAIQIENTTKALVSTTELATYTTKHIIEPEDPEEPTDPTDPEEPTDPTDPEEPTDPTDPTDPSDPDDDKNYKIISGTAWLDENENGRKDQNEKLLDGIVVKLLDTKTNTLVKDNNGNEKIATTDIKGFYSFNNVEQGEYIAIFEYDTSKYMLTTYLKEGVEEQNASKVISKTLELNGENKTVGATEVIKVADSNIANINIGLREAKIFDLKLDKYVSKIIVQNAKGTTTNTYNNETLAKAEIDAKQINNTSVVVEYKFVITNEGEVEGYVQKIVDYVSSDYKFSSELNKDWYQEGSNLYNTSLSNTKILPGETKELTLVLTKQMNENNTGLVNNMAEIIEAYNEQGLSDIDSTLGNKAKNEDDLGSADVILSIKTGQIVTTIVLILTTIVIIGTAVYIITKIILNKRLI